MPKIVPRRSAPGDDQGAGDARRRAIDHLPHRCLPAAGDSAVSSRCSRISRSISALRPIVPTMIASPPPPGAPPRPRRDRREDLPPRAARLHRHPGRTGCAAAARPRSGRARRRSVRTDRSRAVAGQGRRRPQGEQQREGRGGASAAPRHGSRGTTPPCLAQRLGPVMRIIGRRPQRQAVGARRPFCSQEYDCR